MRGWLAASKRPRAGDEDGTTAVSGEELTGLVTFDLPSRITNFKPYSNSNHPIKIWILSDLSKLPWALRRNPRPVTWVLATKLFWGDHPCLICFEMRWSRCHWWTCGAWKRWQLSSGVFLPGFRPHAMPCFRNWLMEMALGNLLIGRDRSDRVFVLLQVIRMLAVGINWACEDWCLEERENRHHPLDAECIRNKDL